MFLLRYHHVNELYLDPETPVYQQTANYPFMHYTVLLFGSFFHILLWQFTFFRVAFFSIYTLFMLYFFHTAPFLCRTFLCINFFMLHYSTLYLFYVALCSCCTILILYFVCVALFLCTALFHVALLHVAKFSFCILLLLLS